MNRKSEHILFTGDCLPYHAFMPRNGNSAATAKPLNRSLSAAKQDVFYMQHVGIRKEVVAGNMAAIAPFLITPCNPTHAKPGPMEMKFLSATSLHTDLTNWGG